MFNSRDPIVMGVTVEAGIIKEGTPICVPSKGVSIGVGFISFPADEICLSASWNKMIFYESQWQNPYEISQIY